MRFRTHAIVALSIAALTVSMFAGAGADVRLNDNGSGATIPCKMILKAVGQPAICNQPFNDNLAPGSDQAIHFCSGVPAGFNNYAVGVGRFDFPSRTAYTAAYAFGNASAGGLYTSVLPDSLVSSVGLYVTGGGTNLMPPPPDSMVSVHVQRNVPSTGQITFTIHGGGMMINAAAGNQTCISTYKVIVYKDQATADADITQQGSGASFYGSVTLTGGAGTSTGMSTVGGFSSGDFDFQPPLSGSKFTVRPHGDVAKVVSVPDANNAVVVTLGDPTSINRPVPGPGLTPLGFLLLSILLMVSGTWMIRSRRSAATA
jgi:hypothetical protein